MQANYSWHESESHTMLAESLADRLVAQIDKSIQSNGIAVIALSGGSTPKPLFKALAQRELDWSKLVITLVDERWVPPGHDLSNESFMQQYLMHDLPDSVTFVPLYMQTENASVSLQAVLTSYCVATNSDPSSPRPFDAVVLGMGIDGHTASFFPDADNIADLVDSNSSDQLLSCNSPATQVERITWSLPMLLDTPFLALHITGQNKRQVFDMAAKGGVITELPIRGVIFQQQTLLYVYYAD